MIPSLQSGVDYGIQLKAFNEKGGSNYTRLLACTLKNPEKQTDLISTAPVIEDIKPFLAILMGGVGGLVLIALLIVIIVRLRGSSGQERGLNTVNNTCANHTPTNNLSNGNSGFCLHEEGGNGEGGRNMGGLFVCTQQHN